MFQSKYIYKNFSSFVKYQKVFPSAKRLFEDYGLDLSNFKNLPIITKALALDFIMKNKKIMKNKSFETIKSSDLIKETIKNKTKEEINIKSNDNNIMIQEYMHKNVIVDNLFIDLNIQPNEYLVKDKVNDKIQSFINKAGKVSLDKLKLDNSTLT